MPETQSEEGGPSLRHFNVHERQSEGGGAWGTVKEMDLV